MTAAVVRLWRHPVKSMRGEELDTLTVADGGVLGDRAHAFVEVETGELVSAKRHGALLGCQARYLNQPTADDPIPPVEVRFPDGTVVSGGDAALTRRVSELLDLEVRLTTSTPGRLVDLAPVHVLAASTLRWLAGQCPGDWDPRRFRPNILVDDVHDPTAEDSWLTCDMHIGEQVVVHVVMPTPRCVMTTHAQGDLVRDRKILRTLSRVRRREVPVLGESPCAGTYAEVVRPGVVRVGDAVHIDKVAARRGAITAALEILQRDRG
jgi:uncharacterized protein YcbX